MKNRIERVWNHQSAAQEPSIFDMFTAEQNTAELELDDAVTVLRNLTPNSHSSEPTLMMREVQRIVNRKVQEALLPLSLTFFFLSAFS